MLAGGANGNSLNSYTADIGVLGREGHAANLVSHLC